ncbi:alanine racemase [Schleiferilactobacillus harbinensis]|uniref:Alanine racemase n=1 Tax=Schleiferilactobacillus harbinensis TaxID=304207 RepID=A0ABU7SXL9_9LACO
MVVAQHRPTRLLISQQAIAHNLAVVRQVSGCRTIFMAVKDNAYGFGLLPVSRAVLAGGAQGLAVAVLDEALVLRTAGIKAPILIMSLLDAQYAQACADQQVIVTVASLAWLQKAQHNLTGTAPLLVSLGLDTGMGRIGYRDRAEIEESIRFLQQHPTQFTYQGLMTHFADSDTVETDYFHRQVRRWHALTDGLPQPPMVHVANSGAAMYHAAEVPTDIIRIGTVVYGMEPSEGTMRPDNYLDQIERLESELIMVKHVPAGEGLSYGHTYVTPTAEWVGTIPIGYGDGLSRKLKGFPVLIQGKKCPIIGNLTMDALMVRLPGPLPVHTPVTLLGQDGDQRLTLTDMAQHTGIAPWELSIRFAERLPRKLVD